MKSLRVVNFGHFVLLESDMECPRTYRVMRLSIYQNMNNDKSRSYIRPTHYKIYEGTPKEILNLLITRYEYVLFETEDISKNINIFIDIVPSVILK